MRGNTRKKLFWALLMIFLLSGGLLLFYAFGWSFNQKADGSFTLQQTGAIYLQTKPADASIKINENLYTRQGSLFNNGGELINGLLPGEYQITINKNEFGKWQKKLLVEAGIITSVSRIFLPPEKIELEPFAQKTAEKIWLTDEKKNEIENIFYSLKRKQLKMPGEVPITGIVSFPGDTDKIVIATQKAIYFFDRQNFVLKLLTLKSTDSLMITEDSQIVFADQTKIHFYDIAQNQIVKSLPLPTDNNETITKIAFSKTQDKIGLLNKKDDFYIYDQTTQKWNFLAEKIRDFQFSPDNKKIAWLTDKNEIEIFFLKDYQLDFKMAAGEKYGLALPAEKPILSFTWLPKIPDYLIIQCPEETIIAETDKRAPTNWWVLADEIQEFVFDKNDELFLRNKNKVFKVTL